MQYELSYNEKSNWEHLFSEDAEFNLHYKQWISAAVPRARVRLLALGTGALIVFGLV